MVTDVLLVNERMIYFHITSLSAFLLWDKIQNKNLIVRNEICDGKKWCKIYRSYMST